MSSAAEPRPVRVPGPVLPVMLDLRGRRCVVVGTTDIAAHRVAALTTAGAVVDTAPTLAEAHLPGARLVFAATGSAVHDAEVAGAAEALGILVNAHDQPDVCAFHMAARLTRGPLEMAFGSGGAVPAVAVRVRNLVAELLPEDLVPLIEEAARVRQQAKVEGHSAMSLDWDELLAPLLAAIDARRRGADGSTP
jgi:uroporphyrin-III C-methyltransferase/precorrin-2 dehydrogenase/sirohydrochlorin ferrochelatase